ncbi:MAG TPA: NDP-hexose 4-ketoreductase, partial [Microlunatus sp.]|nr:NDP-hexose 4-ketoreductase [Microlunatus sp.]
TFGFHKGDQDSSYDGMKERVQERIERVFRPEFLNRVDEIVVFRQLTQEDIERIVDLMVAQIEVRLKDKNMGIELTPAAKSLIAKRGFDPVLGARPLRRAIQRDIEDHMAEKILFSELHPGEIVVVDVADPGSETPFTFTGVARSTAPDTPPVEFGGVIDGLTEPGEPGEAAANDR